MARGVGGVGKDVSREAHVLLEDFDHRVRERLTHDADLAIGTMLSLVFRGPTNQLPEMVDGSLHHHSWDERPRGITRREVGERRLCRNFCTSSL
jgi:hypothetical protein